jgi:pimeloyl-ACP methyl ester carboxylesterase
VLEDILVPATIVAGASDASIPIELLARTAAAIADCEFVRLAGVGHLPMLEAPEATTAALERLIARCTLSAAADPRSVRATRA